MSPEPEVIGQSVLGPVTITPRNTERFDYIREKVRVRKQVLSCRQCPLGDRHNDPVPFSVGKQRPTLAVVGEAPGLQEDRKGEPFVGKSGKLLRKALRREGFDMESVAFLNTVSCLPTDEGRHSNRGRQPRKEEAAACRHNLFDQLQALEPTYVLLCGIHALHSFRPDFKIVKHHGRLYVWQAQWLVIPTYHPASVARQESRDARDAFYDDIARLRLLMKGELPPETMVSGWCTICGEPAEKYDPNLAGYCEEHWSKKTYKLWMASAYEGQKHSYGKGSAMELEMFPDMKREPKRRKLDKIRR